VAVRELSTSPSLTALYVKAMAGAGASLPVVRSLPGLRGQTEVLPDTELVLADVAIDRERLADYCRVCTFEIGDTLPATYPHILAFPLHMQLMSDGAFPFPMIGLVHIGNRIELRRPISASERLTLRVRTSDLRPHDRGRQFDVLAEAAVGGETVWTSGSTYLRREDGGGSSGGRRESSEPPDPEATFEMPGDIGRRYAAVSGDRNPIHLHSLSARLFGLPRAIAHGMWTKARCLALMEGRLPEAYTVEVSFKLPVLLPARVAFSTDARSFALHDAKSGKPHLAGSIA
jgi:MaoC dehydratase-like protein